MRIRQEPDAFEVIANFANAYSPFDVPQHHFAQGLLLTCPEKPATSSTIKHYSIRRQAIQSLFTS